MQDVSISMFVFMPILFFVYGLSFFVLGITISIGYFPSDLTADRFRRFAGSPLGSLSLFGLIHGFVESIDTYMILYDERILPLRFARLFLLSSSFYFLCRFGIFYSDAGGPEKNPARGASQDGQPRVVENIEGNSMRHRLPEIFFGMWVVAFLFVLLRSGLSREAFSKGEIFSRYLIGFPSAAIAALALMKQGSGEPSTARTFRLIASVSFLFYSFFGGLVVPRAEFYPAALLNYQSFRSVVHMPAQLFRSICALAITLSLLRSLRSSRQFFTIRYKAILHIFVAVVIPAFVVILFVSFMIANALLSLSYRENEKLAILTADRAFSFFNNVEEKVKDYLLFARTASSYSRKDILVSLVRDDPVINGIVVVEADREIFRAEKSAFSSGVAYRVSAGELQMDNFLNSAAAAIPDNNFRVSGRPDQKFFMTIPLSGGSVRVFLSLDKLYEIISTLNIEKGWYALILNGNGDVVLPRQKSHFGGKEVAEHRASHRNTGEGLGQGTYGKSVTENGISYESIEQNISPIGWSVIIEIPRNEIVAPIFRVYKGLLSGVFAIYISAIILALIFVGRVTRPINLIAEKVKLIGEGGFDRKLNLKTGDELQTLSEEVDKMAVLLAEKKRMEEQIVQTEKIASLGRLTAGIAHEINNPLGIILGYCQVVLREMEPVDKHHGDLKIIEKHALTCKRIVEDLLRFSRPYKKVNVEVDINANIKESLSLIPAPPLKDKIAITLDADPASPQISGDPDRLHQLFLNLIVNSFDAMKDGGSLTICTRISDPGDSVEITLRDTGCGIREEDIGKVFDPFFTTKEVGKGTGLGLSVSYGIVAEHHGRIWAESEVGKGTVFNIAFPILKNHG